MLRPRQPVPIAFRRVARYFLLECRRSLPAPVDLFLGPAPICAICTIRSQNGRRLQPRNQFDRSTYTDLTFATIPMRMPAPLVRAFGELKPFDAANVRIKDEPCVRRNLCSRTIRTLGGPPACRVRSAIASGLTGPAPLASANQAANNRSKSSTSVKSPSR